MPESKVQKRINPKPWVVAAGVPQSDRLAGVLVGGVLLIIGIACVVVGWCLILGLIGERDAAPGVLLFLAGCFFAFIGMALAGGGAAPWEWWAFVVFGLKWRRSHASARASVIERIAERRQGYEDLYYVYWITVRFESSQGPVVLRAKVSKPQYERLEGARTVNVHYAPKNLRVALLEGEYKEQGAQVAEETELERASQSETEEQRGCAYRLQSLRAGKTGGGGEAKRHRHPIDVLFILGLFPLVVGVVLLFYQGSPLARDARRAKESVVAEAADLKAVMPGEDVVLDGTLGGAAGAGPHWEDEQARGYALVVYTHQWWACTKSGNKGQTCRWKTSASVAPQVITLDGSEVPIVLAEGVTMTGSRFDSPVLRQGDGRRQSGIAENSTRVVGYRAGDPICAFGQKASEGYLLVERLHGGDRDSFMADLEGRAHRNRRAGAIFLGVGLLAELVWAGVRLSSRLLRRGTPLPLLLSLLGAVVRGSHV
jgi:hypothetical protein